MVSERWKALPASEKAEYEATAKQQRSTYEHDFQTFLKGISKDELAAIRARDGKLRVPIASRVQTRKRPLSAYFHYMAEMREKGGNDQIALAKQAGDQWKTMSVSDKQVRKFLATPHIHMYT